MHVCVFLNKVQGKDQKNLALQITICKNMLDKKVLGKINEKIKQNSMYCESMRERQVKR